MVRYAIAVFFVFGSSLEKSVSQYTDCAEDLVWLSDGFCDSATNNLACNYFGGDCCSCTCVETPLYSCGSNGFNCLDPACPDEDPSPYPNCTGNFNWLNDGWCDPIETNNNPACGYDGGDCCACTCVDGPLYSCGSNGLNCDNTACLDLAIAVLYPECVNGWLSIGDGLCNAKNNNQACGYDGGDCCLCTCSASACVYSNFDCLDPSAGDEIYDCSPPPPTPVPCSVDGKRVWVVEDSAQAGALAEAVNCSGGSFEVFWRGEVVVDKTIYVFDGTVLNVTGAGPTASMDGHSTTRLISVVNAWVHLIGVNMTHGIGTVGGAIAAARSNLSFDGSTFFGNVATDHGGAVYASDSSVVSFVGHNIFSGNIAAMGGGAVFVLDSFCTGENMTFFNNTAGHDGGAIVATEHSSLSWSGMTVYYKNRAGGAGGARGAGDRKMFDVAKTITVGAENPPFPGFNNDVEHLAVTTLMRGEHPIDKHTFVQGTDEPTIPGRDIAPINITDMPSVSAIPIRTPAVPPQYRLQPGQPKQGLDFSTIAAAPKINMPFAPIPNVVALNNKREPWNIIATQYGPGGDGSNCAGPLLNDCLIKSDTVIPVAEKIITHDKEERDTEMNWPNKIPAAHVRSTEPQILRIDGDVDLVVTEAAPYEPMVGVGN